MTVPPDCPICKQRPQASYLYRGQPRWRGSCKVCWPGRHRTVADLPEGTTRLRRGRNAWEVVVAGRWVPEARHLAELAGVKLEPGQKVRKRGNRIEVEVWQAVGSAAGKGGRGAGRDGSGDPPPPGTPKRKRQGVFVDLSDEAEEWVAKMAETGGRSRAQVVRDVLYWYAAVHPR